MMKLENWGDLFKHSKELLDDDYNHGQRLVVKTKQRSDDNIFVSFMLTSLIIYTLNLQLHVLYLTMYYNRRPAALPK